MKIILGSKSLSKRRSLEMALNELGIIDYTIECLNSASGVSSKPVGNEIITGADNRNQESKKYAKEHNIEYDYLCAIEGGFILDESDLPFVVTYAIVESKTGKKSTGKSLSIRLTKNVFDFIRNGGSINKIIEEINGTSANKQSDGITGFLTNGIYKRDIVDKDAVFSAFHSFIFKNKRDVLSEAVKKKTLNKSQ